MFDNVAEAFHFHADLNPDLTHIKQPVIHKWTEGEKRRPVERVSAADFQRREQKIAHYLRSIGVRAGTRVAIISAEGPHWAAFEVAVWDADGEVVNIYVRNTAERTGYCLIDSGAKSWSSKTRSNSISCSKSWTNHSPWKGTKRRPNTRRRLSSSRSSRSTPFQFRKSTRDLLRSFSRPKRSSQEPTLPSG